MGKVIKRIAISLISLILFAVVAVYFTVYHVAHGPSETARDMLVQMAMGSSGAKWVPGLFLDKATVDGIMNGMGNTEVIDPVILKPHTQPPSPPPSVEPGVSQPPTPSPPPDEWADAIDGMVLEEYFGLTFKAHVLKIKDPSRVFVAKSKNQYSNNGEGERIFDLVPRLGLVAAINGGAFADPGGVGSGGAPIGLTFSEGVCTWNDNIKSTFIGFDSNDRMIVRESMTKAKAEELGIRDAVCFQNNNTLITSEDGQLLAHYAEKNVSPAQRTAIGQREDGTVIMIVTEGRTAAYIGASHNDMVDAMLRYEAVTAGMLDGGSSAMMFYPGWYEKYGYDSSDLDKFQLQGLVNNYRAFVSPRRLPTFFGVRP